jgi:hypothetical protein
LSPQIFDKCPSILSHRLQASASPLIFFYSLIFRFSLTKSIVLLFLSKKKSIVGTWLSPFGFYLRLRLPGEGSQALSHLTVTPLDGLTCFFLHSLKLGQIFAPEVQAHATQSRPTTSTVQVLHLPHLFSFSFFFRLMVSPRANLRL